MARKEKDWDWTVNSGGNYSFDAAQLAVLMDIRDELKIIKQRLSALECPNFLAIPRTLKRISANTAKPKKPKLRSVA